MEALNGHVGDEHFVHCLEVVPSSEVEMYGQYRQGANSVSIVGRLSTIQSVHYWRFHCIVHRSNRETRFGPPRGKYYNAHACFPQEKWPTVRMAVQRRECWISATHRF